MSDSEELQKWKERAEKAERKLAFERDRHEPNCEWRRGVGMGCTCHEERDLFTSRLKDREYELEREIELREKAEVELAVECEHHTATINELDEMTECAERKQRAVEEIIRERERFREDLILAEKDLNEARRVLWLGHGHQGLYGDDGEMQCATCRLDFKRDPFSELFKTVAQLDRDKIYQYREHTVECAMQRSDWQKVIP